VIATRGLTVCLALLAAPGCKEERVEPGAPSAGSASASATVTTAKARLVGGETVVEEPLVERTAFDLTASEGGALLVFAAPEGGVRARRIGADGRPGATTDVVSQTDRVVELAAAEGGERVAVAWVEQGDVGVRARVALGSAETLSFAPPFDLGAATLSTTDRGHVSVAALGGASTSSGGQRFVVFHRGAKEPCSEAPSGCVVFPLHQVDDQGVTPRRVTLSVPAPCGRGVAGFATVGNRWYYGVCALRDGRSSTTMFTIEHHPEYAQAETVLPGCVPLATAVLGGEALLVGQCGRERRAVRVGRREAVVEAVGLTDVSVTCADGVPRIVASGSSPLDDTLAGSSGDIAALLPARLAPPDARALWTGQALLVAVGSPRGVSVRKHRCAAR
jgi:hypothetical protein